MHRLRSLQNICHMTLNFQQLADDRVLEPIHLAFVDMLQRLDAQAAPAVQLAAAVVSEQLARGHVCLDLQKIGDLAFMAENEGFTPIRYADWPPLDPWCRELEVSRLVESRPIDDREARANRPLVFEPVHQRIYLARYWFYQQRLASMIATRLQSAPLAFDEKQLAADISALFPNKAQSSQRDQCLAAANAVDQRFAVITGGPGTGKTTTVAKLLALRLLQRQTASQHNASTGMRVLLMAPTGKAAQRLNESLSRAAEKLPVDQAVRDALKTITAGTIHRVLGWTPLPPERGGPFRHSSQRPLDADIVLVDEASMVDIGLMWHLFDAVRPETQLVLMGDRDQLASVEAGGVLSDLAGPDDDAAQSSRRDIMAARTGLDLTPAKAPRRKSTTKPALDSQHQAAISVLKFSHRFSSESIFGQLAAAIRAGDADGAVDLLRSADPTRLLWLPQPNTNAALQGVVERAAGQYREYLELLRRQSGEHSAILSALSATRVLCAHREGPSGERALNQRLVHTLDAAGLLHARPQHYPGQAVIVTENNYQQNLFNGDVGVVMPGSSGQGLELLFDDPASPGNSRLIPAALAPATRDCWAMTIHKSQGSEFRNVFVVLPEFDSPILSRELLYTAVTRVKDEANAPAGRAGFLCLAAREEVLRGAIYREIRRTSGIRDAIQHMLAPTSAPPQRKKAKPKSAAPDQKQFTWGDQ